MNKAELQARVAELEEENAALMVEVDDLSGALEEAAVAIEAASTPIVEEKPQPDPFPPNAPLHVCNLVNGGAELSKVNA